MDRNRERSLAHPLKKLILVFLFLSLFNFTTGTAADVPSITLTPRQLCDIELLLSGGFYPLDGFMDRKTYESVVHKMRLPNGSVWPMPIVLDINEKTKEKIQNAGTIALRSPEGVVLATMNITDIYSPDKQVEVSKVYGTTSLEHPGVEFIMNQTEKYYVGGKLTKLAMPRHFDFLNLRRSPDELKAYFKEKGLDKIVAFQTRNPMHRAHLELTERASESLGAHLLIQPIVGMTKPGDVDYFTRVKCYKKLLPYFPEGSVTLSVLPLAMRMAGPREAVWHAIIRRNHGCTHFIVGRDHAGPGKDSKGVDFYDPYAAQQLALKYANEIGIIIVPFKEMVYVKEDDNYQQIDRVEKGKTVLAISGTQLRKMLREGKDIPSWFSYPDVITELRKVYPPRVKQGFTLFFTGLSGSGKSTIANALRTKLMELQNRPITLLDGDIIRTHLSTELGFSKEHRSINVKRVGFVAGEITKNGGICITALISPYEKDRTYVRNLVSENGNYIEVYVSTPMDVCEERDVKGMYAQARQGKIKEFTGIDDPYEVPKKPEITIDTSKTEVGDAVNRILGYLVSEGYIQSTNESI